VIDQLTVLDHYGEDDLRARVNQALQQGGLGAGPVDWSDLAPLDQFHVRGLAATKELAADLRVEVGASVLDVGCGLGGPARFLAATYGCRVTGIDLSQHFVDIATMLTERAGLMGSVRYRQADALDLPFRRRNLRPCMDAARRNEYCRPRAVVRETRFVEAPFHADGLPSGQQTCRSLRDGQYRGDLVSPRRRVSRSTIGWRGRCTSTFKTGIRWP
jgi:SAM-dependent methyltransferase